jgi:hypothetical protein
MRWDSDTIAALETTSTPPPIPVGRSLRQVETCCTCYLFASSRCRPDNKASLKFNKALMQKFSISPLHMIYRTLAHRRTIGIGRRIQPGIHRPGKRRHECSDPGTDNQGNR